MNSLNNPSVNPVRNNKKKQIGKLGTIAFISALGLMITIAVPANAQTSDSFRLPKIPSSAHVIVPAGSQTYVVPSDVQMPSVTRDSFTATDPKILAAQEAAVAAVKKAAEEAAAKALAIQKQAAYLKTLASIEAGNIPAASGTTNSTVGTGTARDIPAGNAPAQNIPVVGIMTAAQEWVGIVPYSMGNTPAEGFACDGYVQYVFGQNGITLPRGADHQAAMGVPIAPSEAKAGDLLWWPGHHIAIYDGHGGYYNSPNWGRFVEHAKTISWGSPIFIRLR